MDGLYKKYAMLFKITETEAEDLIIETYNQENNQEKLLNLVGYDNVEDVAFIISNLAEKKKPIMKVTNKYVEISIAPPKKLHNKNRVSKKRVKECYQSMFEYEFFNEIQSTVFETAYNTNNNFLVSAPTGCGKTDVAMLVILHALEREGKIFLIAPMRALATEIYDKMKHRLTKFKVQVLEYTGDTTTTCEQLNAAKVVIATPEKFDIMTRKLNFDIIVSTLIIDEIHILHDTRGAVIETIVCRMLRHTELFQRHIRIVGLSATLPNYKDVARFIQAQETFYFEPGYRPVPLSISLIGVKKHNEEFSTPSNFSDNIAKKMERMHLSGTKEINLKDLLQQNEAVNEAIYQAKLDSFVKKKTLFERFKTLNDTYNEILTEKIEPLLKDGQQVLVFVTSRKDTEKTANYLKSKFSAGKFDIHHAGLSRVVRLKTEKAFRENKINVIVTTSTLAWGVNLPARCVIIKGTKFYDHESSKLENLGILDILQIFGRAGRPQYDSIGLAYLITDNPSLNEYYQLLSNNTLVESKLLFSFIDIINCEIYLKNITNIIDAVNWLKTTFLFVRMLKSPLLYGFSPVEIENKEIDEVLSEYVLIAIKRLYDTKMITVEGVGLDFITNPLYHITGCTTKKLSSVFSSMFKPTFLGRIASLYYIHIESIHIWVEKIEFVYDEITVLDLLLSSKEFEQVILREEEISNLQMFADDLNIDFEETTKSKMKLLYFLHKLKLQTYSLSLSCDQTYVIENLERLVQGFEEIILELNLFHLYDNVQEIKHTVSKVTAKYNTKTKNRTLKTDQIKVTKIGDYVFVESTNSRNVVVDQNDSVIFVTPSKLSFFRPQVDSFTIRNGRITYVNLSVNETLYKFGVHHCAEASWTIFQHLEVCSHYVISKDTTEDVYTNDYEYIKNGKCKIFSGEIQDNPIKIKFKNYYQIIFEYVDGYIKIENQKLMTYNILELPRSENYLIVVNDRKEAMRTYKNIKMVNTINNTKTKVQVNTKDTIFTGYLIQEYSTVVQNINSIQDNCTIIFKGIMGERFYPVFEILRIVGTRKCILYDTKSVIEYMRSLLY